MRFYLAAKYDKREQVLPIAALLMLAGHDITAQWLNGSHGGTSPEERCKYAKLDLEHIEDCSHFVLFNLPICDAEQSSGRNVELGYALARGKEVIVVGKGDCIFYTLADEHYESVTEFLNTYAKGSSL